MLGSRQCGPYATIQAAAAGSPGPTRPQRIGGGGAAGTMQPPVSAAPRAHAPPAAAT